MHPVWVRFGKPQIPASTKFIDELLRAAHRLQDADPSSACQILLISAVYELGAGRHGDALRTTQHALALAERNSLAREMIWAAWGACAVCFQEDNLEQTAGYLECVKTRLSEQNQWMLADFIEVIKQSLPKAESVSIRECPGLGHDPSHGGVLSLTFDQLRHWGFTLEVGEPNSEMETGRAVRYVAPQEGLPPSSLPNGHKRGTWNSLVRAMKGELRLQWVERKDAQAGQNPSARRPREAERGVQPQTPEDIHQSAIASMSPASVEEPAADSFTHASGPLSSRDRVTGRQAAAPNMVVQMLGPFSLAIQDSPLKLPGSRGLSLLKYLLLHHAQDVPREVLMDVFWRDADPEAARNNLNVAVHSLRQALRTVTDAAVIRFEDGAYGLATDLEIWLDMDEFERCVKEGQRLETGDQVAAAVAEYEIAVDLYQGDFLADSPYEDWTILDRERLQLAYLDTLERLSRLYFGQERYAACVTLCQRLLARDACREDGHRRLMQCYSRLGESPLALRQYQICAQALRAELEANPAPETTRLYSRIRRHERV